MDKELRLSIEIICLTVITAGLIMGVTIKNGQDEKIKFLEQSLNEQIQEKQVYINILERSSNGE